MLNVLEKANVHQHIQSTVLQNKGRPPFEDHALPPIHNIVPVPGHHYKMF